MGEWNLQANDIFLEAIAIDSLEKRQAFLDQAVHGNSELRRQVESLLSSHDDAGSFLQEPLAEFEATEDQGRNQHEGPENEGRTRLGNPGPALGKMIGNYKLLQQIGEGGFGVVYMADQLKPVRRKVAVKIIKPGMDSHEIIARLESERQALAMMDHPNISRVFDAGTTEFGGPYFVMELVKGIPLTKFCDENNLSTRERLELFVMICRAVHHAHQKGIIHRDIKPANILITLHDGKPVPKVIDFGVSKALNQQLTEKTLFTRYGQMVGTPQYMSPEQAEMSGLDIDTRSDVYSLGVVLYELLTGGTPLNADILRNSGYAEMQRMIREQEPPKPSTRLSTLGTGLPRVAETHRTDGGRLQQLVNGELDWITMKALEKERTRRYDSVSSFADDVERFLNNEAVEACPPSTMYRLRKFARRNQGPVAAALAVALVLLLGIAGTSAMYLRSEIQRRKADDLAETNREHAQKAAALAAREGKSRQLAEKATADARMRARELDEALYLYQIKLAHDNILANKPVDARKLLRECKEELRDWEWGYLMRRCYTDAIPPWESPGRVCSIEFGPNDEQILTGHADGTVFLRNSTGKNGFKISTFKEKPTGLHLKTALSPNGKRIATSSSNNTIVLLDAEAGHEMCRLTGHEDAITGVAFNSDGSRLASSASDGTVRIWDTNSGRELKKFSGGVLWKWCVAFGPRGRLLASGGINGELSLWDLESDQLVFRHTNHFAPVCSVSFDHQGKRVASASYDSTIKIWETTTGNQILECKGHNSDITTAVFNPKGTRIASASSDGSVRIWNAQTGKELLKVITAEDEVSGVAFSRDGHKLVAAGIQPSIWLYDATPWNEVQESKPAVLGGFRSRVLALAISPDGKRLAAGGEDGDVRIWDLATDTLEASFDKHGVGDFVFDLTFDPQGRYIFSSGGDPDPHFAFSLRRWDSTTKDGKDDFVIRGDMFTSCGLALSPDGQTLVTSGNAKRLYVVDAHTGKQRPCNARELDEVIDKMAFSPNGEYLVTVTARRRVIRWDAGRFGEQQEGTVLYDGQGAWYGDPGFRPDGKYIAVADGADVVVLNVESAEVLRTLSGHGDTVNCARFSPSGEYLASGSTDGTVRLWRADTGEHLTTLLAEGAIYRVAFTPDGRRLAATGADATVRVWDLGPLYPSDN